RVLGPSSFIIQPRPVPARRIAARTSLLDKALPDAVTTGASLTFMIGTGAQATAANAMISTAAAERMRMFFPLLFGLVLDAGQVYRVYPGAWRRRWQVAACARHTARISR